MKLLQIIEQIVFNTFEGMVRIVYEEGESENLAELLRALPGVLTVTDAGGDAEAGTKTYKVKLITQKNSEEAFEAFKNNAISKYSFITNVEIGTETIEDK